MPDWTGIGSWRIMISVLAGGFLTAAFLNAVSGDDNAAMFAMNPVQHLLVGGFAFGLSLHGNRSGISCHD